MTACQLQLTLSVMPKTRTDVPRDDKVTAILDMAEKHLKERGYNSLSVAAVARELGIAHNAIYWYFPSKDELIVATFEHMVQKLLSRKPKGEKDLIEMVLWFVDNLAELYPLRASMHEQAQRSKTIQAYLDDLNERLRNLLRHVLESLVPPDELEIAVTSLIATVQGAYLWAGPTERRRLVRYTLEKLTGQR